MANYFTSLFGFPEDEYYATRERLSKLATFQTVDADRHYPAERCTFQLDGDANRSVSAGLFSFPSVQELRSRVQEAVANSNDSGKSKMTGQIRIENVVGEARSLHRSVGGSAGAVVQAASQFNLLEFPSPSTVPENGISNYAYDHTQGPACAMACAAGTTYRNYLVPVPFGPPPIDGYTATARGQTHNNQLNGLGDVEAYLIRETSLVRVPWKVRNGYIESNSELLTPLNELLLDSNTTTTTILENADSCSPLAEAIMARLRIGVQEHATVTDDPDLEQTVTQTYNSAVAIGYSRLSTHVWEPLARLVLRASYEATLLVGVLAAVEWQQRARDDANNDGTSDNNISSSNPPPILLTKVGGGVFANKDEWIADAIEYAATRVSEYGVDLDVKIVHFGSVDDEYCNIPGLLEKHKNSVMSELSRNNAA